ncbi:phosphoribosylglycinamide formyltransferase 2 [Mycobacterium kubicae]|uniref:formate-dependent phosphoribosylglycinamide formyltransferase n=1 Tax=Mycobacterium kubicae TaxID=120959 RepID=UPI0007FFE877|nr:phosphoribosylglycinamide formyltransferase 2 [Mycobacterium kubicae]
MTEGLTEGQDEPTGTHPEPAPAEDDKTTVLDIPPAVAPAPLNEPTDEPTAEPADEPVALDSDPRPRVLLLGSGELGRELTVALQRLGAEVIAVDEYADAPAHRVADQQLVVPMTHADELAGVFGRLQPDFVVTLTDAVSVEALEALTAQEAQQADSASGITELVPSARCVRLTADREGLRKLAADQLGLPTAPFWFVGSLGELEAVAAHAGFPLLVKPANGAEHGHTVVKEPAEVERAWHDAVAAYAGSAQPRVWAETVVEVEVLVTLIVIRSEGPSGPVIEFCSPIGHVGVEGGELESWQPQKISAAALDAAKSIAARIVKALGGRGVFSVELMINGDEVYFADVTAWPQETAWPTLRSQRLSVFELQARAIMGLAVDTMMVSPGAARTVGVQTHGAVPTADALTAALATPESDVRVFGGAGGSRHVGTARGLGVALATAPEVTVARDRARDVAVRLNMRDSRE